MLPSLLTLISGVSNCLFFCRRLAQYYYTCPSDVTAVSNEKETVNICQYIWQSSEQVSCLLCEGYLNSQRWCNKLFTRCLAPVDFQRSQICVIQMGNLTDRRVDQNSRSGDANDVNNNLVINQFYILYASKLHYGIENVTPGSFYSPWLVHVASCAQWLDC